MLGGEVGAFYFGGAEGGLAGANRFRLAETLRKASPFLGFFVG
jgi:hypothetical protein